MSEPAPTQIDMQAVIAQLQATADGRNELEKAVQRAQIAALQEQVVALSNGHDPDIVPADEAVSE